MTPPRVINSNNNNNNNNKINDDSYIPKDEWYYNEINSLIIEWMGIVEVN